jgi:hypothetical protein
MKDFHNPQCPKSAYSFFSEHLRAQNPDKKLSVQQISQVWKSDQVSQEIRDSMSQKAAEDKQRYEREMKEWRTKYPEEEEQLREFRRRKREQKKRGKKRSRQKGSEEGSDHEEGSDDDQEPQRSSEKKSRKTKKRDPNAPKRAKNAYLFFCDERMPEFRKQHPDLSYMDAKSKLSKEVWNKMTEQQKAPYLEMNRQDKERYEREKAAYEKGHQNRLVNLVEVESADSFNASKYVVPFHRLSKEESQLLQKLNSSIVDSDSPEETRALLSKIRNFGNDEGDIEMTFTQDHSYTIFTRT